MNINLDDDDTSDVVPLPGPNEMIIAMRGLAKSAGARLPEVDYQRIQGLGCHGTVAALGSGVRDLKPGDEVMGLLKLKGDRNVTPTFLIKLDRSRVCKKPKNFPQMEAAAFSVPFVTAVAVLSHDLNLQLPFLRSQQQNSSATNVVPKSFLVLESGTAQGAIAVQLIRMALPDATIIVSCTAYGDHRLVPLRRYLEELGATYIIDRAAQDFLPQIQSAFRHHTNSDHIDVVIDSLAETQVQRAIERFGMVSQGGKYIVCTDRPVEKSLALLPGENIMTAMGALLAAGKLQPAPAVDFEVSKQQPGGKR